MKQLFLIGFFIQIAVAQSLGQEQICSHAMSRCEKRHMADYLLEQHETALRNVPLPPPGKVRTMAEWEEIQALVITWAGQSTILKEIVRHAVNECKVLIITNNEANVASQLTTAGIPLDSVEFVNAPFNTIWVRDYGPWTVYKNSVDSLWIVDWIYNRPRPDDDAVPGAIANHLDIPIYEATAPPFNWVHTGGNHLPDGMGTVFSSRLVLEENPEKTENQIDSIAEMYLGVHQYIKFPTLPYDGIHHLDMHMRVIDEETIIIGEYPPGVADGPQIESNIQYLQDSFFTSFGNNYNIIRIPMPPDQSGRYPDQDGDYRTYTNSIFLNKTILVPTYEEKYDTTALRIYRENLPGYNVVGINCNSIIPSLGALHCITKTVGDDDPLLITHSRLRDSDNPEAEYPVVAYIQHRYGIKDATLYYRVGTDSLYTEVAMVLTDSAFNQWAALIPSYPAGTEIQYYIHAVAENGKQQVRPIVAPEGYFRFRVLGEPANLAPTVKITSPQDGEIFTMDQGSITISVEANDVDGEIAQTILYINGEVFEVKDTLPYEFEWTFPATGTYSFFATTQDDDGAIASTDSTFITVEGATSVYASDNFSFSVYPNPVSKTLHIDWTSDYLENLEVAVFDLAGKYIRSQQSTDPSMELDFSSLAPGIYTLSVANGEERKLVRVMKQ